MTIMGARNATGMLLLACSLAMSTRTGRAAPAPRAPHLGYAYPAGGQRGATFRVALGGQYLRGANRVLVSGTGVHATVVSHGPVRRRLKPEQRRTLARQLRQLARQKLAPRAGGRGRRGGAGKGRGKGKGKGKGVRPAEGPTMMMEAELPDHPLLRHLDRLSLRELRKVRDYFFDRSQRLQLNPQLSERVVIEVRIDEGAAPGARELRLQSRLGLTNPMRFEVGTHREITEEEINDFDAMVLPALEQPLVLNGQVDVRDLDRFRFHAREGQTLVFLAEARRLVPYLADAVPGWFQATLTLRDGHGREIAFVDDYRFDPDPVLRFEVPADGDYELSIRDAIGRGRRDFVYRIVMGEIPFATGIFPLGGQLGKPAIAELTGWNLPLAQVTLDTHAAGRKTIEGLGLPIRYVVDDLPVSLEDKLERRAGNARSVSLPRVVHGRLERPGEADVYRFEGRAGQEVVAEVLARRLGSPVDSYLELADAKGGVLEASDDVEDKAAGLCTHHADSFLRVRLPADGVYTVRLVDAQRRGGPEFAYRLRLATAQPDFALLVSPSGLNVPAGSSVVLTVHALRTEGFEGDIALGLVGPPAGFSLSGALVPAGRDKVRLTLRAPWRRGADSTELHLEGRAEIGKTTVRHLAQPVDDTMQAFLNRHLVPASALIVNTTRGRRGAHPLQRVGQTPVPLVPGSWTPVRYRARRLPRLDRVKLVLSDPPPGVTLEGFEQTPTGLQLNLRTAAGTAKIGLRDNLIVEVYVEVEQRRRRKKKAVAKSASPKSAKPTEESEKAPKKPALVKRRVYVGVLPAIPVAVVERSARSQTF